MSSGWGKESCRDLTRWDAVFARQAVAATVVLPPFPERDPRCIRKQAASGRMTAGLDSRRCEPAQRSCFLVLPPHGP